MPTVEAASSSEPVQPAGAGRASTLELFFDLVFVFTVTQLSLVIVRRPGWASVGQGMLELLVIFWMYGGFAWLTNTIGSSTLRQRAIVLLGMGALFLVSLAVPGAFGTDGVAFGYAYLALNVVHLAGFFLGESKRAARIMVRVGATNMAAVVLVLAAGYAGAPAHWYLWAAAVAVQWVPPIVTRAAGSFELGSAHFGERHGGMIIIVLGESLLSVALAAQNQRVTFDLVAGALCGLAASAALWWCYFGAGDDEAASQALGRPHRHESLVRLGGYEGAHVLMMAGVVGVAGGTRLSLPHLTSPAPLTAAALIAGGASLYLGGHVLLRAALRCADWRPRLAGAAVVLAAIPVGTSAGAGEELAVVAALLVLMLLTERAFSGRLLGAPSSSR